MPWPQQKPSRINTSLQFLPKNISLGAHFPEKVLQSFYPVPEFLKKTFSTEKIGIAESLLAVKLLSITFRMDTNLEALHEVLLINIPSAFFNPVGTIIQQVFGSEAFSWSQRLRSKTKLSVTLHGSVEYSLSTKTFFFLYPDNKSKCPGFLHHSILLK